MCDPTYARMDELLELLTKSKALHVMLVLDQHVRPMRFTDLKRHVDGTSTTVSRRLKELQAYGLIEQVDDDEASGSYALTFTFTLAYLCFSSQWLLFSKNLEKQLCHSAADRTGTAVYSLWIWCAIAPERRLDGSSSSTSSSASSPSSSSGLPATNNLLTFILLLPLTCG